MQYAHPPIGPPLRTGEWVRKRDNWKLYRTTGAVLDSLRGTEWDAWKMDQPSGRMVYVPNPVWDAAVADFNRCYDLYQQCKPFQPDFGCLFAPLEAAREVGQ